MGENMLSCILDLESNTLLAGLTGFPNKGPMTSLVPDQFVVHITGEMGTLQPTDPTASNT